MSPLAIRSNARSLGSHEDRLTAVDCIGPPIIYLCLFWKIGIPGAVSRLFARCCPLVIGRPRESNANCAIESYTVTWRSCPSNCTGFINAVYSLTNACPVRVLPFPQYFRGLEAHLTSNLALLLVLTNWVFSHWEPPLLHFLWPLQKRFPCVCPSFGT